MERQSCNVCRSTDYSELLNLGKQPLADTFLKLEYSGNAEVHYPLALVECNKCSHVFTRFQVSPEERYIDNDYSYDSSNSPVAEAHFKEFAENIYSTYHRIFLNPNALMALDIGSNVGTLLGYLKEFSNIDVLGVEPSSNIAEIANNRSIKTICELFDSNLIDNGFVSPASIDIVVSTNVVNHMDDLEEMMITIDKIGTPELMFAFEVPYLLDILRQNSFDTVYHEHVNYFSIASIQKLLKGSDFTLVHIEMVDYMGGSIRVYAVRDSHVNSQKISSSVSQYLKTEAEYFNENPDWREALRSNVLEIKKSLLAFVHSAGKNGQKICAIGAATKGNTLLNYCGLDKDSIGVCCDVSSLKVGKTLPGSGIPIIHDDDLDGDWNYGIVLPWNISDFLKNKFSGSGMELIFPIQGVPPVKGE